MEKTLTIIEIDYTKNISRQSKISGDYKLKIIGDEKYNYILYNSSDITDFLQNETKQKPIIGLVSSLNLKNTFNKRFLNYAKYNVENNSTIIRIV